MEEKVIQQESVTPVEQPVVAKADENQAQNQELDRIRADYEQQISSLKKELLTAQEDRLGVKRKLTEVYDQQVIDRDEFRNILVQGEVLPNANEAENN